MTEFIIKQTELSKELGTQHFAHPNKMVKKKKKKIYGLYKKYLAIIIVDECQKIDSVVSKHVIMNSILDPFTLHSLTV